MEGQLRSVLHHDTAFPCLRIRFPLIESGISIHIQVILAGFVLLRQAVICSLFRRDRTGIIVLPKQDPGLFAFRRRRKIDRDLSFPVCVHPIHAIPSLHHLCDRRLRTVILFQINDRAIDRLLSVGSPSDDRLHLFLLSDDPSTGPDRSSGDGHIVCTADFGPIIAPDHLHCSPGDGNVCRISFITTNTGSKSSSRRGHRSSGDGNVCRVSIITATNTGSIVSSGRGHRSSRDGNVCRTSALTATNTGSMSSSGRDHRSSRNYNVCRACAGAAADSCPEVSSCRGQLSVAGYRQFPCRRCVTVFLDRCTLSARIQHIFSLDQEGDIPSAALFYLQRAFPLCPTRIDIHAVQCQTCVCILLHTDRTLGQVRAIMALRTVEGQFRSVLYVENTRTPVVSIAGGITLYDQIRRCQLSQLILLVITNKPYKGTSFKADLRICIFLILGKIQVDLSLFIRLYALKIIICTRHIRDCRLRTIHCGQIYDRLRDRVRAICGTGDRIIYCFLISGCRKSFRPD